MSKKYKPLNEPDPISIIEFMMDQHDLKQSDMIGIIGDKTTVSKVLNKKRPLTLPMIRNLCKKFNISSDLLVNEYKLND